MLEERFIELVDVAGLPQPEINAIVEGLEVDALWRRERVVVELDGRAVHATAKAFERDRERDRVLQTARWRPIRVTGRMVADPAALVADLKRLLAATV